LIKGSKARLWISLTALMVDAAALIAGALTAYILRFSRLVTSVLPSSELPPLDMYLSLALVFTILTLLLFVASGSGAYSSRESAFDAISKSLRLFTISYTLLLAGLFFYRGASFSRVTMAALYLLSGLGLVLSKLLMRAVISSLNRRGVGVRRTAILGSGEGVARVLERVNRRPDFGLKIIGAIGRTTQTVGNVENLGDINETITLIAQYRLDTLIVALTSTESPSLPDLVRSLYGVNVEFLYLPDVEMGDAPPRRIVEISGVPLWALKETPFSGWHGVAKRAFDLIFGLLSSILLLIPALVIALAVKLTSRGPALYIQKRVGLDGRVFNCFKFRSMRLNAESDTGPIWAQKGDPRVTVVGRFLRRFSLDEIPQLLNVLRGDMSLVGPRPERPEFVEQFERSNPGYRERRRVRAGMTGWAQVNGLRGAVPIEERTKYDRYYIENWSLGLDIKILLMTVRAVLFGKDSY